MPTTANFSLEYPDDNSSVDIAGHFETLADDVDEAINTRLALSGGTLTGALVGTLTTDSSSSTTGAFKTAGGMGIAKALYVGTTLNVTGTTTLTGDLTINKASATHTINSTSGTTNVNLDSVAGTYKYLNFRTGTSVRWTLGTTATAESGSNAGTDLFIGRYTDGGAYIDAVLSITRSTGAVTMSRIASPVALGDRISLYDDRNGLDTNHGFGVEASATYYKSTQYHRWYIAANADGGVSDMMQLDNQTLSLAHTTDSSSVSSGSIVTGGGIGIAKALYVGTTLNVAGAATFSNTVQSTGFLASAAAATSAGYQIYTGSSLRWNIRKENTAESGSDAGSDLVINRYNDSGVNQGVNFRIARSTGLTTLYGDLTVSKTGAVITASSTTGNADVIVDGVAGNAMSLRLRTAGNNRWAIQKDTATESGSNVGADFKIWRYTDAGAVIDAPLTITRSTGAVTLTGTLNGKIVNDLVTGPASATDNALVRFDSTTGKVVQNSGITVDDSGNVTSDLVVSKANPAVQMSATSGAADFYLDTTAGNSATIRFRTGTSLRWIVTKDSSAESSTATGSDLYVSGYNNSGSLIGAYLQVQRSTGRFTIYNTGAGAGLRLGSGGPEILSGTGSPEGVVSAPVGSRWIRTDGDTLGDFEYQKRSGTGSTGWVVSEGDTGWRNVTASMEAAFKTSNPNCTLYVRRTNDRVTWMMNETIAGSATGTVVIYVPPTGFKETVGSIPAGVHCINANTGTGLNETFYFASGTTLYGFAWTAIRHQALLSYPLASSTAWPTSLPGSAA